MKRDQLFVGTEKNSSYAVLIVILFAAVLVRLAWLTVQVVNIEGEGTVYARAAENLIKGKGLAGISVAGGTDWMFPPLYPILIAGFSLVAGDFELAGRLASLIVGSCLVIPIYFIACRIYGRTAAS